MPEPTPPPVPVEGGAQMVQYLQQFYPDPLNVTPLQVYALLEQLSYVTQQVKEQWYNDFFTVDAAASVHINNDLERWDKLLGKYYILTGNALGEGVGAVDEYGRSQFYKNVAGPLIAGECFGPPSCSQTLAVGQYPNAVHQVPTATWIYTLQMVMGVAVQSAGNGFYTLLEYAQESAVDLAQDAADALAKLAKDAAEKGGELIGAGAKGFTEGLGEVSTKLLWGLGALVGLVGLIWIGGQAASSAAGGKR